MSKTKHLARLGAAVILATGVFAGIPGPANAASEGNGYRPSLSIGTDDASQSTGTTDDGASIQRVDTGWG
jgi:hypothetical protein